MRIWFLLHILRMNGQNLTRFAIHIIYKTYERHTWAAGINCYNLIYLSRATTSKQSYKRTLSISVFWQCADDIELIFAQICAFIWTTVWWCFGKDFFYFLVFGKKNAKSNVFDDKCFFFSKMFSQTKMQAATNWSSHLRKYQTFHFFQTTDFLCNFQKSHFSEIFENHQ